MSATLAPQEWHEVTAPPPGIALAAAGVMAGYDAGTLACDELCRLVAELASRADLWEPLVVRDAARRRYRLLLEDARPPGGLPRLRRGARVAARARRRRDR